MPETGSWADFSGNRDARTSLVFPILSHSGRLGLEKTDSMWAPRRMANVAGAGRDFMWALAVRLTQFGGRDRRSICFKLPALPLGW